MINYFEWLEVRYVVSSVQNQAEFLLSRIIKETTRMCSKMVWFCINRVRQTRAGNELIHSGLQRPRGHLVLFTAKKWSSLGKYF